MIHVKRLCDSAVLPKKSHGDDAGFDLVSSEDTFIPIKGSRVVSTGVAIRLPLGTVGMVCSRSGLAAKKNIAVLNAPGIIDAGYRGEIKVILFNHGNDSVRVNAGDRIAQLVVCHHTTDRMEEVAELDSTDRNTRGLGSTGR